jgi:hypothetical protein
MAQKQTVMPINQREIECQSNGVVKAIRAKPREQSPAHNRNLAPLTEIQWRINGAKNTKKIDLRH